VLGLCAAMSGTVEEHPFGEGVAVFKVGGRMFALVPLDGSPGGVTSSATRGWLWNCETATRRSVPVTNRTSGTGTLRGAWPNVRSKWTPRRLTTGRRPVGFGEPAVILPKLRSRGAAICRG
jgi:hypothetical protein